jgi:hypothetical protein
MKRYHLFNADDFLLNIDRVGFSGFPLELGLDPYHLVVRTAKRIEKF